MIIFLPQGGNAIVRYWNPNLLSHCGNDCQVEAWNESRGRTLLTKTPSTNNSRPSYVYIIIVYILARVCMHMRILRSCLNTSVRDLYNKYKKKTARVSRDGKYTNKSQCTRCIPAQLFIVFKPHLYYTLLERHCHQEQMPFSITRKRGGSCLLYLYGSYAPEDADEPPDKVTATETALTKAGTESEAMSIPVGVGPAYGFPQQQKFSGEDLEGETFEDWIEQFELVAKLYKWSEAAKLVNLITRLRGPAYSFYRACLPEQKESYTVLKQELTKRFTPVQIQAIQSELFHDRKQKDGESVDEYAQDLRRLFRKAYGKAQQGSQEAKKMERSVLAYQFVAGLCQKLKANMAGCEGNYDQLLILDPFEDAKFRPSSTDKQMKKKVRSNLLQPLLREATLTRMLSAMSVDRWSTLPGFVDMPIVGVKMKLTNRKQIGSTCICSNQHGCSSDRLCMRAVENCDAKAA